jgi:exopolysaccharide production protein ExoQ
VLLGFGAWLLVTCHSSTALFCALMAVLLFWASKYLAGIRRPITGIATCVAIICGLLWVAQIPGVKQSIYSALGRDQTLTGRTEIWRLVREQNINPVVGCGFQSFWNSQPGAEVYDELRDTNIRTAHNGYLETYLDGGLVGIVLLTIMLLSATYKAIKAVVTTGGRLVDRFALIFCLVALAYNWTESDFFRLEPLWFAFLLFTLNSPLRGARGADEEALISTPFQLSRV